MKSKFWADIIAQSQIMNRHIEILLTGAVDFANVQFFLCVPSLTSCLFIGLHQ